MKAVLLLAAASMASSAAEPPLLPLLPGFRASPWFGEQVREEWHEGGVRIFINGPGNFDGTKPTHIVVYATPNGNTLEQTLGCAGAVGLDWHFDIQHIAAQTRRLRQLTPHENTVLAIVEAGGLTWPNYRAKFKDNPDRIRGFVEQIRKRIPGESHLTLTGHSGGGSFLSGFLNAQETIPKHVTRIAHLDSNYSYSDDDKHGDKLLTWLQSGKDNRLVVIAYDDREIMLNGKKVVGATGGTWRATDRMLTRFGKDLAFTTTITGDIETRTALDHRFLIHRHRNPQNKILHTALVGEMNGYLEALGHGRNLKWGTFGGERAFSKWIQPAPGIPPRPKESLPVSKLLPILQPLTKAEREARIAKEILSGNIPDFERQFVTVKFDVKDTAGKVHSVAIEVLPDYLSVGSDADWMRMPMTPQTATRIGEAFGCVLPTRTLVHRIHAAAAVRLEPIPLGEPREAVQQFANHHALIEKQRAGQALGELVSGIKKDIVLSNRIFEKPNRLALYGWHKSDGTAIQPLTIVHHDGYVDYSHGVRLIKRTVIVDGQPKDIRDLLRDAELSLSVSDEGVLTRPGYD